MRINPHYRSEGRRQGSGAVFWAKLVILCILYEKVTRILKETLYFFGTIFRYGDEGEKRTKNIVKLLYLPTRELL